MNPMETTITARFRKIHAGPTTERRNLSLTSCTPSRTQMCHNPADRTTSRNA